MKIQSLARLFLFSSLSATCYAAVLPFPVNGVTNGAVLGGDWTQSDSVAAASKLAWYTTIGSPVAYEGVSVGAFYDDYTGVGTDFTVGHSLNSISVGSATIDWSFSITSPTDFPTRNDYSISVLGPSAANILTINLTYLSGSQYSAFANGNYFGVIDSDGLYGLDVNFSGGLNVMIDGLGGMDIFYTDPSFDPTGKTFGSVQIGTTLGFGNTEFGDGIITVVPEPGTTMLAALLPAFFVFRRRR